jgi:hypothetical protein
MSKLVARDQVTIASLYKSDNPVNRQSLPSFSSCVATTLGQTASRSSQISATVAVRRFCNKSDRLPVHNTDTLELFHST